MFKKLNYNTCNVSNVLKYWTLDPLFSGIDCHMLLVKYLTYLLGKVFCL